MGREVQVIIMASGIDRSWYLAQAPVTQVEHVIDDNKMKSAERAERLKRLQPRTPPPSDDEDQAGA
jgi:hypothetical protein